jgi:type VI protein secretion system component Hcp
MIRLYKVHEFQTTGNQYFNYSLINFVISLMKRHTDKQNSRNLSYTNVLITYNHLTGSFSVEDGV